MPRFGRVIVPQCPHHITQRGNERRNVFFTPADRDVYLGLLKQYSELYAVEVLAYCLMTNHVHLILRPQRPGALAKAMREVQMRYSQYRHAVERGNGHLWQCRYYSCPVDPERLGGVARYVELNPVRAGLVADAVMYRWSSAAAHTGARDSSEVLSMTDWRERWSPAEWAAILNAGGDESATIRDATYGGRPLGSEEFVGRLEATLERSLRRGSPGRPKKNMADRARAAG